MIGYPIIEAGVLGWAVAQLIKAVAYFVRNKRITLQALVGAGGMPSSHAAFVCAVAYAAGWCYGISSGTFAVAMALALVVMYDAIGVRWEAGRHAAAINELRGDDEEKPLKESLGHRPLEVFCGLLLGLALAALVCLGYPHG